MINAIEFPRWISDTAFTIPYFDWPVKWYGISYLVGIGLAYIWAIRTTGKKHLWQPTSEVTRGAEAVPTRLMLEDFLTYCFIGILVGGRLGSLILYTPPETFLDIFKVWEGGMAFHGGFIGVCVLIGSQALESSGALLETPGRIACFMAAQGRVTVSLRRSAISSVIVLSI